MGSARWPPAPPPAARRATKPRCGRIGCRPPENREQVNCFAGLTDVAVPVVIRGRHVATLMSGQVFRREPTQRDFAMIPKILGKGRDMEWEAKLRKAYFDTPVVAAERFEAIIQLLAFMPNILRTIPNCWRLKSRTPSRRLCPGPRGSSRRRSDEPITLGQVVAHVRVSRFYFCKLFKRATGMTLTEYVTLVRLEKVKGAPWRPLAADIGDRVRCRVRVHPAIQQRVQAPLWDAAH